MVKKYENYKDSGIEWIGEIPESWEVKRLKFLVDIIPSNVDKKSKEDEQSVLLCNYVDVYKNDYINEDISFMHATASDTQIDKLTLLQNDVIATKDSEDPNDIGVPALVIKNLGNVVCGYHLTLFRSKNENEFGKYLFWYLKSNNCSQYFSTIARGITRYALGTSAFSNLAIPKLDEIEYILIANYLDRKTAEIDDLITKKEKLIALYKEERTATINQAVTCGMDQHNNLRQRPQCLPAKGWKDSGIEWLGEIPAHWEVKRLRHLVHIRYGLGQPPKQKFDGLPIIRATNVYRGSISSKNMIYVDPDDLPMDRNPILKVNDIIIVRSGAYTADSALITKEWEGSVTGYDIVVTPHSINPKLLAYSLLSNYMLQNQLFINRLRAAQPHLNAEEIGETFMLIPSRNEQNKIVEYLIEKLEEFDTLNTKTKKEIELLKEYKTALISEVVLGKVDVREKVFN